MNDKDSTHQTAPYSNDCSPPHPPDQGRRPCMRDLLEIAQRDPLVKTYLSLWENGLCSLEDMLIALVVVLHPFKRRAEQWELDRIQKAQMSPPLMVDLKPKTGG